MLSAVLCSINMQYHEMNYGIAGQFDWLFRTAYANETRSRKPIVSQRFPISTCNIPYRLTYIYEFMSSTATYVNFKHLSEHNGQHIHWWIYMYVYSASILYLYVYISSVCIYESELCCKQETIDPLKKCHNKVGFSRHLNCCNSMWDDISKNVANLEQLSVLQSAIKFS